MPGDFQENMELLYFFLMLMLVVAVRYMTHFHGV
jgi:hypothetical protein